MDGKFVLLNFIGKEFKCIVIIWGMLFFGVKWYMFVYWWNFIFKVLEVDNIVKDLEMCGKVYVILYKGKGINVVEKEMFCGLNVLFIYIEWEGEYVILFFYVDYWFLLFLDLDDFFKFLYFEIFFWFDIILFDFGKLCLLLIFNFEFKIIIW